MLLIICILLSLLLSLVYSKISGNYLYFEALLNYMTEGNYFIDLCKSNNLNPISYAYKPPLYSIFLYITQNFRDYFNLIVFLQSLFFFTLIKFLVLFNLKFLSPSFLYLLLFAMFCMKSFLLIVSSVTPDILSISFLYFSIFALFLNNLNIRTICISSFFLALSLLFRPIGLYPYLLMSLIIILFEYKFYLKKIILHMSFVALFISPWVLRNYTILGKPILSSNGGINLYLGAIDLKYTKNNSNKFESINCELPPFKFINNENELNDFYVGLAIKKIKSDFKSYFLLIVTKVIKQTFYPNFNNQFFLKKNIGINIERYFYIKLILSFFFTIGLIHLFLNRKYIYLYVFTFFVLTIIVSSMSYFNSRFFLMYLPLYFSICLYGVNCLQGLLNKHLKRRCF